MKKLMVSLALFSLVGVVYASTLNDLTVQYWNGSSYTTTDLTPYSSEDAFLMYDYLNGGYKLQRAPGYLHVGEINGMTAQLSNMQNDINDRAYASHQHASFNDIIGLQSALDGKASASLVATATTTLTSSVTTLTSSLSALQTQVNAISTSSPVITMGASRNIASLTSATGTMLSSTKTSNVMYSVNIVTTATIGGASGGEILLEVSPTNTATSTWTVINRVKNSQTITLAVALNSIQDITYNIMGNVPSGYYMRLRSNTLSGTPTYSFVTGQEMQF